MGHDVAGKGVAVCLGAALRVEDLGDIAEVAEDVEGIEGEGEACLGEGLADARVPYEVVGVGRAAGISAAAVHRQVGGELHPEGQVHERGDAVVEVINVDCRKVLTIGGAAAIADVTFCSELDILVYLVIETQAVSKPVGHHATPFRRFASVSTYEVHAVGHAPVGVVVQSNVFLLVK